MTINLSSVWGKLIWRRRNPSSWPSSSKTTQKPSQIIKTHTISPISLAASILFILLTSPPLTNAGFNNLAYEFCRRTVPTIADQQSSEAIITGLIGVHGVSEAGILCGRVDRQGAEILETMKWALKRINDLQPNSFVPGIQIGLDIKDTCGNEEIGTSEVLMAYSDLYSTPDDCVFNTTKIKLGLIGPNSADGAKSVAGFLSKFNYPTISSAILPQTTKQSQPLLFSSMPNTQTYAEALISSARNLGWTRVSLVTSDDEYGREGNEKVMELAKKYQMCIANHVQLNNEETQGSMQEKLESLFQYLPDSPGVLVFASKPHALNIFKAYSATQPKIGVSNRVLRWMFAGGLELDATDLSSFPKDAIKSIFLIGSSGPLEIDELKEHWSGLNVTESPVLSQLLQQENSCRISGMTSGEFLKYPPCRSDDLKLKPIHPNPFLIGALDGLYTYVTALKEAWNRKCPRGPGLCPQLVRMSNEEWTELLVNTKVVYGPELRSAASLNGRTIELGRRGMPQIGVYQLVQRNSGLLYKQLYTLESDGAISPVSKPIFYNLDKATGKSILTNSPPTSTCPFIGDCECISSLTTDEQSYEYRSGQLNLAAILPVHNLGGDLQSCQDIRLTSGGYQVAEAFWYALNNLNDKQGPFEQILPDIKLGGLIMDSCQSPLKASYLVGGLLSSKMEFLDSVTDMKLKFKDVFGVVGGLSDNTTTEIASLLAYTGLPHISLGASSAVLNDPALYPTTLRTLHSDATKLRLLIALLKKMRWNEVQVVFTESEYARLNFNLFKLAAVDAEVCIAQSVQLSSNTLDSASLTQSAGKIADMPSVKVIVVFGEPQSIRRLLASMKTTTKDKFTFIFPQRLKNHKKLFRGLNDVVDTAISLKIKQPVNVSFKQHLMKKLVAEVKNSPWEKEYIETLLDCKLSDPNNPCIPTDNFFPEGTRMDRFSNDVVNSVYSLAFAMHAMLQQYCGPQYRGICQAFTAMSEKERNAGLYEAVRNIKFRDESNTLFMFSGDERDSSQPIHLVSLRATPGQVGQLQTKKIGSYEWEKGVRVEDEAMEVYGMIKSSCVACKCNKEHSNEKELKETVQEIIAAEIVADVTPSPVDVQPVPIEDPPPPFLYSESPNSLLLAGLFSVHKAGISPFICGPISEEGVLMLESYLWALDTINSNPELLRGMKLGAVALDTCRSQGQTFQLLQDLLTKHSYYAKNKTSIVNAEEIYGVINSGGIEAGKVASRILSSYKITDVGPDSSLSSPFAMKTTIPFKEEVKGVLALMKQFGWDYVSVVHSASPEGRGMAYQFQSMAIKEGVCVGSSGGLHFHPDNQTSIEQLIRTISDRSNFGARAVLLLLNSPEEVQRFLSAVKVAVDSGKVHRGQLTFIGLSSWGTSVQTIQGIEDSAMGSIILDSEIVGVDALMDYLQRLNYTNNERNPWWTQYFQIKHGCTPETCPLIPFNVESVEMKSVYSSVINSVFALAVALGNLQQQYCRPEDALCQNLLQQPNLNTLILESVQAVAFSRGDHANQTFQFTDDRFVRGRLRILNLMYANDIMKGTNDGDGGSSISNSTTTTTPAGLAIKKIRYQQVGYFADGKLRMKTPPVAYTEGQKRLKIAGNLRSTCHESTECSDCAFLLQHARSTDYRKERPSIKSASSSSTKGVVAAPSAPTSTIVSSPGGTTSSAATNAEQQEVTIVTNETVNAYPSNRMIFIPPNTNDGLIIANVLPLHKQGGKPLSCGALNPIEYQVLEGYLWALNRINADPKLLPGVSLGSLVLDSCEDTTKAVTDLSNFLSGVLQFRSTLNGTAVADPNGVVSVLASSNENEALGLATVSSQFRIPVLAGGSAINSLEWLGPQSEMFSTAVSPLEQIQSILAIIRSMGWESFSMLYSSDIWGMEGRKFMERELAGGESGNDKQQPEKMLCMSLLEDLPGRGCHHPHHWNQIDNVITTLIHLKEAGNYGVVLWLSPESLSCFLDGVSRAIRIGSVSPGDFSWIVPQRIPDLKALIMDKEESAVGMISLQGGPDYIPEFQRYWKSVTPEDDPNPVNPWKAEFFQEIFGCHGTSCVRAGEYRENALLLNTVNSLYAVAYALHKLRDEQCGSNTEGVCPEFRQTLSTDPDALRLAISQAEFLDPTGEYFKFGNDGSRNGRIRITNLVTDGEGYHVQTVGSYGDGMLNMTSSLQGFQLGSQPFFLEDRPSICQDYTLCTQCLTGPTGNIKMEQIFDEDGTGPVRSPIIGPADSSSLATGAPLSATSTTRLSANYPLPPANESLRDVVIGDSQLTLIATVPVHSPDGILCGPINTHTGFLNMAAFIYGVKQVNDDPHLLPSNKLSLIGIDSCGLEERTVTQLYEQLTSRQMLKSPKHALAVVGGSETEDHTASEMIRQLSIPQVMTLPSDEYPQLINAAGSMEIVLTVYYGIIRNLEWSYVSILTQDNRPFKQYADRLKTKLAIENVCVGEKVTVSATPSLKEMQLAVRRLVLAAGARAVVLFLSHDNIVLMMAAIREESVSPSRFIFVTSYGEEFNEHPGFRASLTDFHQGLITVQLSPIANIGFRDWLANLTLENTQGIPKLWLEQWWQQYFMCRIPHSTVSSGGFGPVCTGMERVDLNAFRYSSGVSRTILAVQTVARALQHFLQKYCPGRIVSTITECGGSESQGRLARMMKGLNYTYNGDITTLVAVDEQGFIETPLSIRNLGRLPSGDFQSVQIGQWNSANGLMMDTLKVIIGSDGRFPESKCNDDQCGSKCGRGINYVNEIGIQPDRAEVTSASSRFSSIWGIVLGSIAGLGMLICFVTIFYFFVTFPINYGTTICGYVTLMGLVMVYGTALLFVLPPSGICCAFRRIFFGVSWSFVYAPILVKVAYTYTIRMGKGMEDDPRTPRTSAFSLITVTLGLASVQILMALEWIVLQTANEVVYEKNFGGLWLCSPGLKVEGMLAMSMLYVFLLLALCILFALLTWRSNMHNGESPWLFIACLYSAVLWTIWTLCATNIAPHVRDPLTAICLVVNATGVLLIVYLRQAYLYQKYRQEVKDFLNESHAASYPTCGMLGTQFMMSSGSTISQQKSIVGVGGGGSGGGGGGGGGGGHPPPSSSSGLSVADSNGNNSTAIYNSLGYNGGSEFNPAAAAKSVMLVENDSGEICHRF